MAADLHKKTDVSPLTEMKIKMEAFLQRHAFIFLMFSFIILCILIMLLIYAVFGAKPSVTDSNGYYYHLKDII